MGAEQWYHLISRRLHLGPPRTAEVQCQLPTRKDEFSPGDAPVQGPILPPEGLELGVVAVQPAMVCT